MKKFIINTCFFIVPFFTLFVINILLYDQRGPEGDLARMGYFYKNPAPTSLIKDQYRLAKQYTLLSEINLSSTQSETDILTIGDSFSEQDSLGYKNFLASKGLSVVHVDRAISGENPIQTLISLMNADFFEMIRPRHVVLQTIERDFNVRTASIDFEEKAKNINFYKPEGTFTILSHNNETDDATQNQILRFFSDATLKLPLNNLFYLIMDKPFSSNTYKVKSTSSNLFSNSPDNLLFYKNDLKRLDVKNNSSMTLNGIKVLNKLSDLLARKNIELIVIVSPDKYDLYYPYIEDKSTYEKPTFFSTYEGAPKEYKDLDIHRIFSEKLLEEKDIYYYDDTHWSPKGAKIVAEEIFDQIIN